MPGAKSAIEVCVTLGAPDSIAAAELTLNVSERAVELVFRTEHFEALAIQRIAEHVRALLVGLVEAPGPVFGHPTRAR